MSNDVKVKGHQHLHRRNGAEIVNKDCNYTAALKRLEQEREKKDFNERLTALETNVQLILNLLTQKETT